MKLFDRKNQKLILKTNFKNWLKASVFLFVGFILTIFATYQTAKNEQDDAKREFASVCNEMKIKISERLHAHAQLLRSGSAFFAGSITVTRNEWKKFNEREKINKNLPGIQSVGFSLIIPKNKLYQHIQSIRKEGFPDYIVKPKGDRDIYSSIIYLEPFSGRNLRAFGYDMLTEPVRRKAMDIARDSDIACLSGKVQLVQETNKDIQAGTLMYVPVYRNGLPINTFEQRRAAILGWVYSPYRMGDLMQGILGRWDSNGHSRIKLQVYDDKVSINSLLFDSQKTDKLHHNKLPSLIHTMPVEFNGAKWILCFSQSYEHGYLSKGIVLIVFFCGIAISLLLFFLSLAIFSTHSRALQIAEQLTSDLKESETKFEKLFESANDAIFILKGNTFVDCNLKTEKFFRGSKMEIIGSTVELLSPAVQPDGQDSSMKAKEKINAALTGNPQFFEWTHRRLDGTIFDTEVSLNKVELSGSTFLQAIVRDISERKLSEKVIHDSEVRYRSLFENSPSGILVLDENGFILDANDSVSKITLYAFDELIGSNVKILLSPEEEHQAAENITRILAGDILVHEVVNRKKDGTFCILVLREIAITLPNGQRGVLSVSNDITIRKHAEEALQESENRYKTLFENTGTSIIIIEEDMTISLANEEFARRTGYSRSEIEGVKRWMEIVDREDIERMVKQHHLRRENPDYAIPVYEFRYRTKSGELRHALINVQLIPGTGKSIGSLIDITERKQADDILARTRQNYETFFNTIDDFLFVLDEQGNIIYTNDTVIKRLGYTHDELIGNSVLMVHPPERRDEAGRIVGEMLNGITESCPVPIMTKSGIQIPVETKVVAGFWDGKPVIFGVTKDISKIELSEEKFSKLFHINPFACGLSDLDDHKYIEVNDVFYTLFGFTSDEVIGKTALDLGIFTNEIRDAILLKADSNGKVINVKANLKAKNGEIKDVLLSAENIYVQDKKYRFTVVQDITALKIIERELLETLSLTEATIESVNNGILVVSPQGTVIKYNTKFAEMWQIPDDIMASGDDKILLNTVCRLLVDPDGFAARIAEVYGKPVANSLDILYLKDGRVFERLSKPMYLGIEPKGRVWSFLDITERLQSEQEIVQKNEVLVKLNAEKDRFFSIIAHDLRGPFNGLLGLTQLLSDELPGMTKDEITKIALAMKNSANKLYNLLVNLLEWSVMQRGLDTFKPQSFVLLNGIAPIIELVRDAANKKMISITYDVPEDIRVMADKSMFNSLMRNLLFNAIKFTHQKGEISIEAMPRPGNFVQISIKDNGIGMSQDIVKNLFHLDSQVNRKGTEGEPSTGLGLIICSDIIDKHSGKLWVESEEGKGSTFRFTLPVRLNS
jgi:PAS domain S-box-containing protein